MESASARAWRQRYLEYFSVRNSIWLKESSFSSSCMCDLMRGISPSSPFIHILFWLPVQAWLTAGSADGRKPAGKSSITNETMRERERERERNLIWGFLLVKSIFASQGVGVASSDQLITIVMSVFKAKTSIFRGWAPSCRLCTVMLRVPEGVQEFGTRHCWFYSGKNERFGGEVVCVWKSSGLSLKRFEVFSSSSGGWEIQTWWDVLHSREPFLDHSFRGLISSCICRLENSIHLAPQQEAAAATWSPETCWHISFWNYYW